MYTASIALHVAIAVLGVGMLGAIPIVASFARRNGPALGLYTGVLDLLFRLTRWGLAAVAITGALTDLAAGGAFHQSAWFRASVGLLILAAVAHARARAALRRSLASDDAGREALRPVERWGWTTCAAVALIAVLMEAKPWS